MSLRREILKRKTLICVRSTDELLDSDQILGQAGETIVFMNKESTYTWAMPSAANKLTYEVPGNVQIAWIDSSARESIIASSGTEVIRSLTGDLKTSAKYLAVTGSLSVGASLETHYKDSSMYALILDNYEGYVATLNMTRSFPEQVNPVFLTDLTRIPSSFDKNDEASWKPFFSFFDRWGTHIVTKASYGQRLIVEVEEQKMDEEITKNFSANIKAAYKNIMTEVEFDASVKGSDEYKRFQTTKTERVIIQGGDFQAHGALRASPLDRDAFLKWSSSRANAGAEKALVVELEPLVDQFELFTSHENTDRRAQLAAMRSALKCRMSYRWLRTPSVPGSAYGPQCLVIKSKENCSISLEFSNDPLFRIEVSPRQPYDSPTGSFTISADQKSIHFSGKNNISDPGWGSHASFHFDMYCGSATDVKLKRDRTATSVWLYHGKPGMFGRWGFGDGDGNEITGQGLDLSLGSSRGYL